MTRVTRTFSFHSERDKDIGEFLAGEANASATIRKALRLLMESGGPLEAVLSELRAMNARLAGMIVEEEQSSSVDDEAKEILSDLGRW